MSQSQETPATARAGRLRRSVETARLRWDAIPAARRHERAGPGAWSPIELLGHLVDSASNNHQRFVRAMFVDHLEFPGYDQDAWVAGQGYQNGDWECLLSLWHSFNLHIAQIMERTPAEVLERPRARHSLDQIAFRPRRRDEEVTLAWFMDDYIDHLDHHMSRVPGPAR